MSSKKLSVKEKQVLYEAAEILICDYQVDLACFAIYEVDSCNQGYARALAKKFTAFYSLGHGAIFDFHKVEKDNENRSLMRAIALILFAELG